MSSHASLLWGLPPSPKTLALHSLPVPGGDPQHADGLRLADLPFSVLTKALSRIRILPEMKSPKPQLWQGRLKLLTRTRIPTAGFKASLQGRPAPRAVTFAISRPRGGHCWHRASCSARCQPHREAACVAGERYRDAGFPARAGRGTGSAG